MVIVKVFFGRNELLYNLNWSKDLGKTEKTEYRHWFILYLLCTSGCVWVHVVLVKERTQYSPHHIIVLLHLRCSWCATFQGKYYFPLSLINFPVGEVVYCSLFFVGRGVLLFFVDLNSAGRYSTKSFPESFPAELGWLRLGISQVTATAIRSLLNDFSYFRGDLSYAVWVEFGHVCDISIRSKGIFWDN